MATPLSKLLYAAFRIAGVTDRPGRTPSPEQLADALDIANRMVGSWNVDRLKILGTRIDAYTLVPGQKIFTLGGPTVTPTNLSVTRPIKITRANIIYNTTSPVVRLPVGLLSDDDWADIQVQDIPGTVPWSLYNDESYPASNLYLYGQALAAYQLELYTWQTIAEFATIGDAVVLAPGYELAFTFCLGVLIAAAFPTQAHIAPESAQIARDALMAIESQNAPAPVMACDSAMLGLGRRRGIGNYYGYLGNNF